MAKYSKKYHDISKALDRIKELKGSDTKKSWKVVFSIDEATEEEFNYIILKI